jgi:hypothetical protein
MRRPLAKLILLSEVYLIYAHWEGLKLCWELLEYIKLALSGGQVTICCPRPPFN